MLEGLALMGIMVGAFILFGMLLEALPEWLLVGGFVGGLGWWLLS